MTDKYTKRGYTKWTDENGVFHKEIATDATDPRNRLAAEEATRLNAAAEAYLEEREEYTQDELEAQLEALQASPADVLTADDLVKIEDGVYADPETVESVDHANGDNNNNGDNF